MKKTYAEICLERADKTSDVSELARRLNKAVQSLRQLCIIYETKTDRECSARKLIDELEAIPGEE